jgi:hypothetical protein
MCPRSSVGFASYLAAAARSAIATALTAARKRLMLIVPLRFNDLIFLTCTFGFFFAAEVRTGARARRRDGTPALLRPGILNASFVTDGIYISLPLSLLRKASI